jgi:FAD/FMN-containing dehydrogenase/Fe-S oxidoreductase
VNTGNSEKFLQELNKVFPDEVRSDQMSRGLYSTDASIYQQMPLAAITPKNRIEIQKIIELAAEYEIGVLPRAAGTSLAGQTTGEDVLVVDISKHLDQILEVKKSEGWALVEPGVIRDRLNAALKEKGVMFAPETSTSNRANIAGMIANDSSGMMSLRFGTTKHHVLGADTILADGTPCYFGLPEEMDEKGRSLLDGLLDIVERNRTLIEERYPKVLRRVGGYSLDRFLTEIPNLANILPGSEGTLAFMTTCKVKLVPLPKMVVGVACHFKEMIESLHAVPIMVKHGCLSAEFMDGALVELCKNNPATKKMMGWLRGEPGAVIPVEFDGDSVEDCESRMDAMIEEVKAAGLGYDFAKLMTPEELKDIAETRKAGLGVMNTVAGAKKAISFVEDACVPIEHLADYAAGVIEIIHNEDLELMTYGHASVGVLHLKPIVDLKTQEDRDKCTRISKKCMELCKSYGGSWSGEHGDGIARGAYNEEFWGAEMIEVFREVKRLFDPKGIFNPGTIFDTPPVMGPLRYSDGYAKLQYQSMYHFESEGGLQHAVEMCSGVGACRKIDEGLMCPSYNATRDEKDSTRGRANALRLAMSGQLGPEALSSKELYEVLDLCLECKGCKTECPSNVDMAKMKSEFLHAYHQKHGIKWREKLFAYSPDAGKMNSGLLAPIVNTVFAVPFLRKAFTKTMGIATERAFPTYSPIKFSTWFKRHQEPNLPADAPEVVLFDDTYIRYHETHNGVWAVRILEHLGYKVHLANAGCCCRTFMSKGILDEAKKRGTKTMMNLDKFAQKGLPILGVEPSCTSALRSDLPDLMDDREMGERVSNHVLPIEEFLDGQVIAGKIKVELPHAKDHYLLHGHCHQKSLFGTDPLKRLMGSTDNGDARIQELDTGCCGMAGSFGYEQEHYDLSMRIGEDKLFPAIRKAKEGTGFIACGFSCRHQIKDGTGEKAMHFIEALGRAMLGDE